MQARLFTMLLSAPSPFSFILFGASGHLAQIKLYPALYILALKKRLPKDYAVIGFARSQMSDASFRDLVSKAIQKDMGEVNEKILNDFLEHVHYEQGDYDEEKDFAELAKRLDALEKGWKDAVRLAYYSVPPEMFAHVSRNLCAGGVHKAGQAFRCIVEKPVGQNLKSFEEVKRELLTCFQEEDIYLLDHYLGKEAVRNVYYLRYANPVLERIFKNTLIHHVEITAAESAGLEGRAGYFEAAGTFRDMFQSHLLMVMALLTMRLREQEVSIAESRRDALAQMYLPPASDLHEIVLQGQYEAGMIDGRKVPGYREEDGVDAASRTNTFAALKLMTRTSRWEGVPFYLRSGKRMTKKETRISFQFQMPHTIGKGSVPNRLDIILQGEAGMRFHMQTKIGGTEPEFRPLVMADPLVCMGDCLPEHGLLTLEAIHGRRQWFLSFEEVHDAWKLIDPLITHLEQKSTPLHGYKAGTGGPQQADEWVRNNGAEWF